MRRPLARTLQFLASTAALALGAVGLAHAQAVARAPDPASTLDSLMAMARKGAPTVLAAEARLRAARANIAPAGTLEDPTLMLGVVNLPLGEPGFQDEMAMKMAGVEQTLPLHGKRKLRRTVAGYEADMAVSELEQERRVAARDVAWAYLELALTDSLERLTERQHRLLLTVAQTTRASYAAGRGGQEEPLRIQTELVRLSGEVTALRTERVRGLARLNAALGRSPGVSVGPALYPDRLRRAVAAEGLGTTPFADTTLGAAVTGGDLPGADTLQRGVVDSNPMITAHLAELAAQSARAQLAAREARPDPTLLLQYGQRDGLTDMVTATLSFPLPFWGARKQSQRAAAERATLEALEHEHHRMAAELEAEVLDLRQTVELHRTRLALYQAGVLPRSQAAAQAALAGYRTGRTEFQGVLDSYMALYRDEAEAVRLLTQFGKTILAIEALVGREVVS
jgi:cobalt-zinc-cadmium efflux system outer membrane protein